MDITIILIIAIVCLFLSFLLNLGEKSEEEVSMGKKTMKEYKKEFEKYLLWRFRLAKACRKKYEHLTSYDLADSKNIEDKEKRIFLEGMRNALNISKEESLAIESELKKKLGINRYREHST